MTRDKLINRLSAADAVLNVIIHRIEKAAPIVLNYRDSDSRAPEITVLDLFRRAKQILLDTMDESD